MSGKVLITGGLGNLGSNITQEFSKCGYDVYVLTLKEKCKLLNSVYTVIEADISDLENLKIKLDIEFDYCVHLASFKENYPRKALTVNSLGTRNLLEVLAGKNLKRFIYFSTFHVYGANDGLVNELSALNPKNDYASTHLFAEYYVKQFGVMSGLNYTIFRLSNCYGAPLFKNTNKWYLILNDLVRSAYENHKIIIKSNGKISKDFIWMQDVVSITHQALKLRKNGIYNLSSNKSYQLIEIANMIKFEYEKRYNKTIRIKINKDDKTEYKNLVVSNSKLRNELDIELHEMFSVEINKIFNLLECR